jgi:hypothetical protein
MPQCLFAYFRLQIKQKLGIKDDVVMDFICSACCSCCTIAQAAREVDARTGVSVSCPCNLNQLPGGPQPCQPGQQMMYAGQMPPAYYMGGQQVQGAPGMVVQPGMVMQPGMAQPGMVQPMQPQPGYVIATPAVEMTNNPSAPPGQ